MHWYPRNLNGSSQCETPAGDRFIPNRSLMDLSHAQVLLNSKPVQKDPNSPFNEQYRKKVEEKLTLDSEGRPFRMMVFRGTPTSCRRSLRYVNDSVLQDEQELHNKFKRIQRLPKTADRVLSAPNLNDNFYFNLIDWGKNNSLAICLGSDLYIWNGEDSKYHKLMHADDLHDYPTSVAWSLNAKRLAVGLNFSKIQLWDVTSSRLVRTLEGHRKRVGCLAWNGHLLTSGSQDKLIINHDERMKESLVSRMRAHSSEVCGLKWSESGCQLASGGNDNVIHIWEASQMKNFSQHFKDHHAAVKALAWCPHQSGILASGGGTADRCIKLWNTQTGKCLQSIDTTSQVCALEWNRHHKEILSGHGYTANQLSLWAYPSMSKIADLPGHRSRILCLSQSPDGLTVVSAGADESIRFWKVFEPPEARPADDVDSLLSLKRFHIR